MKITEASIDSVSPDPRNANTGTDRGREALRHSLASYGAGRSILLDRHSRVIAGNKTLSAAAGLGHEDLLIVDTDGSKLVAVRRTDLDLDEPEARELALSDNRIAELDLSWSAEAIDEALKDGLALSALWTGDELEELLASLSPAGGLIEEADPDFVPEAVEPRCKLGELWAMGPHLLYVGDCTDTDAIRRLWGDEKAEIILTDPPYCSGGFQEAGRTKGSTTSQKKGAALLRDHLTTEGLETLIERAIGRIPAVGCCYVFCDWRQLFAIRRAVEPLGYQYRALLVWDKQTPGMGGPWRHQHELIYFGTRRKEAATGNSGDVLQVTRTGNDLHTTQKPVKLIARILENSEGNVVADPFAGSGTTLIACEQVGRTFRGCELDPHYADTIVTRWEAATDQSARRL
jgi:DNA modification methylase